MSELEKTDAYFHWIGELKKRYRATQIKAAVSVNAALLEFYWELGLDISERYPGKKRDAQFFQRLSADLKIALPDASGLSPTNIKYSRYFFELNAIGPYRQQVADDNGECLPSGEADLVAYRPQVVDDGNGMPPIVPNLLVRVPWGHHRIIIDKCKGDVAKALFYVRKTVENGWSRNVPGVRAEPGNMERRSVA